MGYHTRTNENMRKLGLNPRQTASTGAKTGDSVVFDQFVEQLKPESAARMWAVLEAASQASSPEPIRLGDQVSVYLLPKLRKKAGALVDAEIKALETKINELKRMQV